LGNRLNHVPKEAEGVRPAETRAKILAATDHLFGDLGFDATTTRDIAERSGVNKALIHYHFGSKDELLAALLDDYYDRLTAALVSALGRRTALEAQAEDVVDAYADFLAENRTFCSIVQREVASGRHVERIVARTLPSFRLGTQWLGQLVPGAPEGLELIHLLTSVYGMVVTYFTYGRVLQQLTGTDPFSADALESRKRHVRHVVALLFRELTPTARGTAWPRSTPRTPRKKQSS
jgi:TetR/AcrR family transcriptional regulator